MSDFKIRFQTEIDQGSLQSAIEKAGKRAKLKLGNITIDTTGLAAKIQKALDGHPFTLKLSNVNVGKLPAAITGQMKAAGAQAGQNFSQSLVDKINRQMSNGGFEASIAKLTSKFDKLSAAGISDSKIHGQLLMVKNDLTELNRLQDAMINAKGPQELVAHYNNFVSVLDRAKNSMSIATAQSKNFVSSVQIAGLDNKIAMWMERNSRAANTFGGQLQVLRQELAKMAQAGKATTGAFEPLERKFNEIRLQAAAAGQTGQTFATAFKSTFANVRNWFSAAVVIGQAANGLKQMYQNVYNIDTEMTELKKVTDETDASYNKFLQRSAVSAKALGTTISDLVSSSADFARLGYSFADSEELAKVANIYNVVGDEVDGIDTATKSLISTMTAFKDEMSGATTQGEFALSIIDKFNEVGKQYAQQRSNALSASSYIGQKPEAVKTEERLCKCKESVTTVIPCMATYGVPLLPCCTG